MAYQNTEEDFNGQYKDQLRFLNSSTVNYDRGDLAEAKRLATIISNLIYDGKSSISLLSHLRKKNTLRFVSTRVWNERNLLPTEIGLASIKVTSTTSAYAPLLGNMLQSFCALLSFEDWWDQKILRDKNRNTLTRGELIKSLRDQDGGSHIDKDLSKTAYASIAKANGAGWEFHCALDSGYISPGPHFASMRQIVWEVQYSLRIPN